VLLGNSRDTDQKRAARAEDKKKTLAKNDGHFNFLSSFFQSYGAIEAPACVWSRPCACVSEQTEDERRHCRPKRKNRHFFEAKHPVYEDDKSALVLLGGSLLPCGFFFGPQIGRWLAQRTLKWFRKIKKSKLLPCDASERQEQEDADRAKSL
jgi:hypothetical protein